MWKGTSAARHFPASLSDLSCRGHQLGNTLSTLRTYFDLGARYVTLTHTCNNALAECVFGLHVSNRVAANGNARFQLVRNARHADSRTLGWTLAFRSHRRQGDEPTRHGAFSLHSLLS